MKKTSKSIEYSTWGMGNSIALALNQIDWTALSMPTKHKTSNSQYLQIEQSKSKEPEKREKEFVNEDDIVALNENIKIKVE